MVTSVEQTALPYQLMEIEFAECFDILVADEKMYWLADTKRLSIN